MTDVQTAVTAHLVIVARLAGGPVAPTEETARWAAERLTWHSRTSLTFVYDDAHPEGPSTVHVTGEDAKDCLATLLESLASPERRAAAQARIDAGLSRGDA